MGRSGSGRGTRDGKVSRDSALKAGPSGGGPAVSAESLLRWAGSVPLSARPLGEDKVFISDVYDRYRAAGGTMSLGDFKERLLDMNRDRTIDLSRIDLVEGVPRDQFHKIRLSEATRHGAEKHFLRVPARGGRR
jgi:hypothetical protein